MKNIFKIFLLLILISQIPVSCTGPKMAAKKQKARHLSSYEMQTLADSILPVMMPYNRWIDPAGEQIYFGDKELENHALDCAVSPDGKWIAVEGRYSVVIISSETNKIVHRLLLSDILEKGKMSGTFSGIKWHSENGKDMLYWSASGDGGKSYVIKASWDNKKLEVVKTFVFEAKSPSEVALANELVVSEENGALFFYLLY
ncbi:MAG: hypothetical protein IPF54_22880 [Draconibacterium sp.]|nr:hypothetical protein [Draconibacterium sp.]